MEGDPAAVQWSHDNFRDAPLGDARLSKRAVKVVACIRADPQASLTRQCQDRAALEAAYRLLSNPRVDSQALQMPHRQLTARRCQDQQAVLIVQDTTQLDFSKRAARGSITGVGPLGSKDANGAGLIQHAALAVSVEGEVIGVVDQQWHCQQRSKPGETRRERRQRGTEADNWADTARAVDTLDFGDARLIHVGDRHCDVFDFFQTAQALGHGFVTRVMHNRYVDQGEYRLADKLALQPIVDTQTIRVPARSGSASTSRRAREAKLSLRYCMVELCPPRNDSRYKGVPPQPVYAIQLTEVDPPDGEEPITWTLVTSEGVHSVEDAWRIVTYYRKRWTIEEWHRVLKDGCKLERSRLDHADDIKRLAAIKGPVAADLLKLRDLADDDEHADDPVTLQALLPRLMLLAAAKLLKVAPDTLTPRQFWRLLAKKGGHLGRKNDPRPGWEAIWIGWQQVALIAQGVALVLGEEDV